uniref:Uncharacterized protein n=1 Tax=Knipowitschia caucasica TaxID=637954 RepID=A0AAV2M503_KNICA
MMRPRPIVTRCPTFKTFPYIWRGSPCSLKVDLVRGYHQVRCTLADIPKTAVVTPFGLFEFLRMPFGLKNAAQSFPAANGLGTQGHAFHLRLLGRCPLCRQLLGGGAPDTSPSSFYTARPARLIINPAKCVFGVPYHKVPWASHHQAVVGAVQLGLDYERMGADQPQTAPFSPLKDSGHWTAAGKGRGRRFWGQVVRAKVFVVPERRFDHVNIDLVGPASPFTWFHLPPHDGRQDDAPGLEAVPLASITSADVARAFIGTWGFTRFGLPRRSGTLWRGVWVSSCTHPPHTTPRLTDCVNVSTAYEGSLRASLTDGNWVDKLRLGSCLALGTAPRRICSLSSAEPCLRPALRVPGDYIPDATRTLVPATETARSSLREVATGFAPVPTSQHCSPESRMPAGLRSASFVFVRHDAHRGPLRPPYDGPFKVLQHGDKSLVVDIGGPTPRTPPSTLFPWSVGSSFDRDGAGCVPASLTPQPLPHVLGVVGHHSIPEWGF